MPEEAVHTVALTGCVDRPMLAWIQAISSKLADGSRP